MEIQRMEQWHLRRIFQRLLSPRILRFAAVGLSGVVVNLGTLFILSEGLRIEDRVSSAIAIELSILSNFLLNNAWTFADKNEQARRTFSNRLLHYNLVSLVGFAIQFVTFIALTSLAQHMMQLKEPGIWKYPSQLAGIAIAMSWNFLSNFFWVWAQDEPPAKTAPELDPS